MPFDSAYTVSNDIKLSHHPRIRIRARARDVPINRLVIDLFIDIRLVVIVNIVILMGVRRVIVVIVETGIPSTSPVRTSAVAWSGRA